MTRHNRLKSVLQNIQVFTRNVYKTKENNKNNKTIKRVI